MSDVKSDVWYENDVTGDWIRNGPEAVEELLISEREKNPCKVAKRMRAEGRDKAVIFKWLLKACREYRDKQDRSGSR